MAQPKKKDKHTPATITCLGCGENFIFPAQCKCDRDRAKRKNKNGKG
jgi:hypothetical protein